MHWHICVAAVNNMGSNRDFIRHSQFAAKFTVTLWTAEHQHFLLQYIIVPYQNTDIQSTYTFCHKSTRTDHVVNRRRLLLCNIILIYSKSKSNKALKIIIENFESVFKASVELFWTSSMMSKRFPSNNNLIFRILQKSQKAKSREFRCWLNITLPLFLKNMHKIFALWKISCSALACHYN